MTTVGPKLLALAIQLREPTDALQSATSVHFYRRIIPADGVIGTVPQPNTMRSITALIVTLITCTLGCDNVTVDAPFGDSARTSTLESFRGTWTDKQGNVYFVERGVTSDLVVGFTEWNSGSNVFETQSVPISVRTIHNRTFLFFPHDTRENDKLVFFWLSEIKDGSIFARACNADAFRKAVTSGKLDGNVTERKNDHFHVHLTSLEMLKTLLASPDGDMLFEKQGADPLRRLTSRTDGEP